MNQYTHAALNLCRSGNTLIVNLKNYHECLLAVLDELKSHPSAQVNYCVVSHIFNETTIEVYEMLESIEQIIDEVEETEIEETLWSIYKELEELQNKHSNLEKRIRPYLYCPALNKPEHCN